MRNTPRIICYRTQRLHQPYLSHAAGPPVRATGVAGGPRARGRALGRVVDVAGAAFGVADRQGPRAGPVLVAARCLSHIAAKQ